MERYLDMLKKPMNDMEQFTLYTPMESEEIVGGIRADRKGGGIDIGQTFNMGGTTWRVRAITNKDIVCRPESWDQSEEA